MTEELTKDAGELGFGNVTHLQYQGKDIYIVGTAHVSKRSVEEVASVIESLKPDTVCVELDKTRYDAMVDDNRWRRLDIFQVLRQKKGLFLLSNLALAAYQKRLAEQLGVEPGAEMKEAIRQAEAIEAHVVLADRDIQATLKRTWHSLSFFQKNQVISVLLAAFFSANKVSEEQVEALKEKDQLTSAMKEFAKELPAVKEPLIDERDRYLMASIREAPGKTIVAVVGAGHVEGMLENLETPVDRQELSKIPPPSKLGKALKWILPAIVVGAFYFGYQEQQGKGVQEMLYAWALPNAVFAAGFTACALARPLTVATAFVASPITSLNPALGAGMVAGFVEAWLRKPTVEDCERVNTDMLSVKGMYSNRFTRVLLVTLLATIGSAVGAWVGASWVLSLLA